MLEDEWASTNIDIEAKAEEAVLQTFDKRPRITPCIGSAASKVQKKMEEIPS